MPIGLDELRRFAVARSLFAPTTLERALERFGFVQADPIRAPARAQDLTMRHRVAGYRAGDLERRYAALGIEEDFFINYGFVSPSVYALMHPRRIVPAWPAGGKTRAERLLAFVRERGAVHPRDAHERFAHGTVTNYWGGSSNATTHLLDALHYRGLLRVAGRRSGIRIYAARDRDPLPLDKQAVRERVDALIDVVVRIYAPLPRPCLAWTANRLRYAVPQWSSELKAGIRRAFERLAHARVDGVDWFWPAGESPDAAESTDAVRLLSPFDPVVWDRRRFELLWGWPYRFEAYTPAAKRKMGYYALPLLWRDRVIGWGNLTWRNGDLRADLGYVGTGKPAGRVFTRAIEQELDRMRAFLAGEEELPAAPAAAARRPG
jgi:uncharacterized protein YcaQ